MQLIRCGGSILLEMRVTMQMVMKCLLRSRELHPTTGLAILTAVLLDIARYRCVVKLLLKQLKPAVLTAVMPTDCRLLRQ